SCIVALLLGVSTTFWSQSVIAEVYTPNAFFYFGLLYLGLLLTENWTKKGLFLWGLLYGLGIANSWPLLVLASGAFLFIVWPRRRELFKDGWILLGGFILGVLPYTFLYFRASFEPQVFFLGPLREWKEVWDSFTRKEYAAD